MQISLHKNATTTPAIRRILQTSTLPETTLAKQFSVTVTTVRRWKARSTVEDQSHRPHNLHATLTAAQESIVLTLRRDYRLPLDDLLALIREFIHPTMGRNALQRMLRRHGENRLPQPEKIKTPHKPFKDYLPGFFHVDIKYLPQMADEKSHRYLFVAIDRATRWVFIRCYPDKSAASAGSFLVELETHSPIKIEKLLTDNGKEFRADFDEYCKIFDIEHRRTKPYHPQTNGMVERFNGRISDILKSKHFDSSWDLEQTLMEYCKVYNEHLPQRKLGYKPPWDKMKDYFADHPECFTAMTRINGLVIHNQPRHDS